MYSVFRYYHCTIFFIEKLVEHKSRNPWKSFWLQPQWVYELVEWKKKKTKQNNNNNNERNKINRKFERLFWKEFVWYLILSIVRNLFVQTGRIMHMPLATKSFVSLNSVLKIKLKKKKTLLQLCVLSIFIKKKKKNPFE